jgi:hypothetical protein
MAQDAAGDSMTLSFVMPSKYSLASLPQPNSADVTLREVPGFLAAVLGFSGHVGGKAAVEAKQREVLAMIQVRHLGEGGGGSAGLPLMDGAASRQRAPAHVCSHCAGGLRNSSAAPRWARWAGPQP